MISATPKAVAFTLIELLIVIAIIAILAAMLLPALSRNKWQAKIVLTQSNYKQMALGFISYASDNARMLPMHNSKNESGGFYESRDGACLSSLDHDWRVSLVGYGVLPATGHPITGAPEWTDDGNSRADFVRNVQQAWYNRTKWRTAPTRFAAPRLSQAAGSSTLFMDWLRYSEGSSRYYGVNYNWGTGSALSAPSEESSARMTWSGGLVPQRFLTTGFDGAVRFTTFSELEWYYGNASYRHFYKPIE